MTRGRIRRYVFQYIVRYQRDEEGSLIIFSLFIFLAMIMFGGIAVDLMLYENQRTHIQNSADRAVLAAANLNQTVDPKEVVKDYLAKVGITVTDDDINVVEVSAGTIVTGRQVSVDVAATYDTLLMDIMGVETLSYSTMSEAEEAVNDIEVSLILDVSGSMYGTKLSQMQDAAKDFVDQVLAGAPADNRVSLSLVPYSTQVSVGPDLLPLLNTEHNHTHSYCVNFDPGTFTSTGIDHTETLSQTAHFDPWRSYRYGRTLRYPVCRPNSYMHIQPWSNNRTDLKDQIDDFEANGNTSIDVAMKWGTALLDPSMQGQLDSLIASGDVTSAFAPRPHAYSYEDTFKFVVLMTDGINTTQYTLDDNVKSGASNICKDPWGDYMMYVPEDGASSGDWWNLSRRQYEHNPSGGVCYTMDWLDVWAEMNMSWRSYRGYYRRNWDVDEYYDEIYDHRTAIGGSQKDTNLAQICSAAKAQGIVVFTIGFEVTDHSANVMRACASTPSHFYRVEGLDIEAAFASIANQINQLKLTQ